MIRAAVILACAVLGCASRPTPPVLSPAEAAILLVDSNQAQAIALARLCQPVAVVDAAGDAWLRQRAAASGSDVVEVLYRDRKVTAVLHRCPEQLDIAMYLADAK